MAQPVLSIRATDDDRLLDRLGEALADPPPPGLETIARQLLTWRTVDVELAELLDEDRAHAPASPD